MEELNNLIELLLCNLKPSQSVQYLRTNYDSLKKLQIYIKENKIIPRMETLSKSN